MLTNSLVSILIPSYNHEKYITECLDSCLNQVDGPLEILVLDDGSSDNTFKLACQWKQKHESELILIKVWTRPNRGVCPTLNELIHASNGEFIAWLASDDLLIPGSIMKRKLHLEKHPEKWAVFCDAIAIDSKGVEFSNSCLTGLKVVSNKIALGSSRFLMSELLLRWNGSGPVLMVKRTAYDSEYGVGLYDEKLFFEDRDMYLRLIARDKLIFYDMIVAKYRITNSSMSRGEAYSSKMKIAMMQSNRKALGYASGVSKWILRLLVVSGEARWSWKPRLVWLPVGIMATIFKKIFLFVHDVYVYCDYKRGGGA